MAHNKPNSGSNGMPPRQLNLATQRSRQIRRRSGASSSHSERRPLVPIAAPHEKVRAKVP